MVVFQKLKLQQIINLSNCTQIKDMYTNVVTCIRACDGEFDAFPIKIGLHQKSVLSQYIFTSVMDEITKDIQGDIP
jgi:SAM-dependent MidA family methyltransferase